MADERASIYFDPTSEHWTYRLSALGRCSKALLALRLGYTPQDSLAKMAGIFREGDLHEQAVILTLKSEGWEVKSTQEIVEQQVWLSDQPGDNVVLRGHTDGRLANMANGYGDVLLEVKALGDSTFAAWTRLLPEGKGLGAFSSDPLDWPTLPAAWPGWERWESYAWQISSYSHILDLPKILYAVKSRNDGKLARAWVTPPFTFQQIEERLREIEFMAVVGDVQMCEKSGFNCEFQSLLHSAKPLDAPLDGPEAQVLESLLERFVFLTERIDKCKAERDGDDKLGIIGLREKIVHLMGDKSKVAAGGFVASVSQGTSQRLNTERVKARLEEEGTLDDYQITTPWQRVSVKKTKGTKDDD